MKKFKFILALLILSQVLWAQHAGNINVSNPYTNIARFPDQNINVAFGAATESVISVKGMANIKADNFVAMFSITQVGATTEEVNALMDARINDVQKNIDGKSSVDLHIDMISFIPKFEYEVERRLFSKKTYNEIPAGFELKKNLHVRFSDPNYIQELIAVCAKAEIYDLVKVDYYSEQLEAIKEQLRAQSRTVLQAKLKDYEVLLTDDFSTKEKEMVEGYRLLYPVEMYSSYQAFSRANLHLKKPAHVKNVQPNKTFFYQSIVNKEFDFVIDPVIVEPVIQVLYEVKIKVRRPLKKEEPVQKKYLMITPDGILKELNL